MDREDADCTSRRRCPPDTGQRISGHYPSHSGTAATERPEAGIATSVPAARSPLKITECRFRSYGSPFRFRAGPAGPLPVGRVRAGVRVAAVDGCPDSRDGHRHPRCCGAAAQRVGRDDRGATSGRAAQCGGRPRSRSGGNAGRSARRRRAAAGDVTGRRTSRPAARAAGRPRVHPPPLSIRDRAQPGHGHTRS